MTWWHFKRELERTGGSTSYLGAGFPHHAPIVMVNEMDCACHDEALLFATVAGTLVSILKGRKHHIIVQSPEELFTRASIHVQNHV
jgi:hypothetical protein